AEPIQEPTGNLAKSGSMGKKVVKLRIERCPRMAPRSASQPRRSQSFGAKRPTRASRVIAMTFTETVGSILESFREIGPPRECNLYLDRPSPSPRCHGFLLGDFRHLPITTAAPGSARELRKTNYTSPHGPIRRLQPHRCHSPLARSPGGPP